MTTPAYKYVYDINTSEVRVYDYKKANDSFSSDLTYRKKWAHDTLSSPEAFLRHLNLVFGTIKGRYTIEDYVHLRTSRLIVLILYKVTNA